jgi:hypothetical protein
LVDFNKLFEDHEALRRLTDPYGMKDAYSGGLLSLTEPSYNKAIQQVAEATRNLEIQNRVQQIAEASRIWDHQNQIKLVAEAAGTFHDQSSIQQALEASKILTVHDRMQQIAEATASFRIAKIDEVDRLATQALAHSSYSKLLESVDLNARMAAMHHPWLSDDPNRSSGAFAALQSIGAGLSTRLPFETEFTSTIRQSLGDWRDRFDPSMATLLNPTLRLGLYAERGFDFALTDFSEAAFSESVGLAGLELRVPGISDGEDLSEVEIGLRRNATAFDDIQRFEFRIRRFIESRMLRIGGEHWMKQRVPGEILERWREKKKIALKAGQPDCPLIDYADFTDYKIIIEQANNWRDCFAPCFDRKENVRESLQRLYPVRIAVDHTRFITRDDALMLLVETRRLLKAMEQAIG